MENIKNIKKHTIRFLPSGLPIDVADGTTIMDAARKAGVFINAPCGGDGKCLKCTVEVTSDGVTTTQLACRYKVTSDIDVTAPEKTASKIAESGTSRKIDPLLSEMISKNIEIRGIEQPLVMAFDIGTTTVVGYLISAESGETISTVSRMNPQAQYGADVIKRAEYAMQSGGEALSRIIKDAVSDMIGEAASLAGADRQNIALVMLAGNTCMNHLFMGFPVRRLVTAPYKPAQNYSPVITAAECGINDSGYAAWLPNIDGFVGSDTVAVLLDVEMDKLEKPSLILDIGTNGEVAAGDRNRYIVCSTAAGPAFEGVGISCGMRAFTGAIDRAEITPDGVELGVIGGGKPHGICGSGLLDIVAAMLKHGVIDDSGRFADDDELPEYLRAMVTGNGAERRLVLARGSDSASGKEIAVTQKDVREVQLAKAAIAAGVKTVLRELRISFSQLDGVMLSGAFGNYASEESLCTVGLLPRECAGKIVHIGNAAGEGAKLAAINYNEYKRAVKIAENAEYLELATNKTFQELYIEEMAF